MLSHSEIVDLRPVSRLRSSNAMLQYEGEAWGGRDRIESIDLDALNVNHPTGLAYARKTFAKRFRGCLNAKIRCIPHSSVPVWGGGITAGPGIRRVDI